MAVGLVLCPDGNERYTLPKTTADANAWLQRVGVQHIRFGTSNGKYVIRSVADNKVRATGVKVSDLCAFIGTQPLQMNRFGIPFCDFYVPQNYDWGTGITLQVYFSEMK